ncbi:magnesium transporter [Erwinia sp. HR93]|uniref:magnesium transporter n=1 Tax=Erwinia sp. HR93 TaxID=3094840 RepID=UPI002ADEB59C|nr:magnesium transporter [Erwinia sp. HR93]MEA1065515.1 magnesium transporter [Erwinia sp. HR93]
MSVLTNYTPHHRAEDRARIIQILSGDRDIATAIVGNTPDDDAGLRARFQAQLQTLTRPVSRLPPPDLADTLEALPALERHALWRLIPEAKRGRVLLEASKHVWDDLIEEMSDKALLSALSTLDIDEQMYLAQHLPRDLVGRLLVTLPAGERERARQLMRYEKPSVGAIMEFEVIVVRADVNLATVQRYLRFLKKMPENTDKLFVTTRDSELLGELDLTTILLHSPQTRVAQVMEHNPVTFFPTDNEEAAALIFERDNLISAAVIDEQGKLMGRLAIDEIVDVVIGETDSDLRRMGGLSAEEDVFAPVMKAVKTRWAWLAINLCTAFIASRVIHGFEGTISHLVALASLMPIVAGIGGNTGNQTITMIVRSLALQYIQPGNVTFLLLREVGVALINGMVWGGIMGLITWGLYGDAALGGVMTLAMMLNLLVAAVMGVIIPMAMYHLGRDPAVGSSVMITAITDTGGFFIFLGLATLFLM